MFKGCYFSSVGDKFNFGRFRDWSLAEVITVNQSYIYWCINNHVIIGFSKEAIREIQMLFPSFILGYDFADKIYTCQEWWEMQRGLALMVESDCDSDDFDDYVMDEEPTYERYGGSYAQDEMGYSDDEIDTIFDGDPMAYWNID